jgi:peptide chain release factor 2
MKVLRARLLDRLMKQREEELAKERAGQSEVAWGSQIRSYVLHPYQMIKDHRTGVETGNVKAVLDGEIDRFIEAYLKHALTKATG